MSVAVQVMLLTAPAFRLSPPSGALTVTTGSSVSGRRMVKFALLASSPRLLWASWATTFTRAEAVATEGTVHG